VTNHNESDIALRIRELMKRLARPTGFEPVTPAFGALNLSNVLVGFDRAGSVSC
jgi:hypothetical protein